MTNRIQDDGGFGASVALVIGIGAYGEGVPTLETPVGDASEVARVLRERHGYDVRTCLDGEATREELLSLLRDWLPQRCASRDSRFLLYFAGHGFAADSHDRLGPEGYLVPQDANLQKGSLLPMREVYEALAKLPSRHGLVVLDCCFAGAFRWAGTRTAWPSERRMTLERYRRYVSRPAWQAITSAAYDELAQDRTVAGHAVGKRGSDEEGRSPFARALILALEGEADDDGDGVFTASDLLRFIQDEIGRPAERQGLRPPAQTPQIWPLPLHRQGEYVFRFPNARLRSVGALDAAQNPYRGLEAYRKEDAEGFFGRSDEIRRLRQAVAERSFVALVGASGTGKSSLVRAGLAVQLESREGWELVAVVRPSRDPMAELNAEIGPRLGGGSGANFGTEAFFEWMAADPQRRAALVIDQAEELVTVAEFGDRPRAFLEALAEAQRRLGGRLRIVATVRADFEPAVRKVFDEHGPKGWMEGRFVVAPFSTSDLREAIEGPAARIDLFFESAELVDDLVEEVANMPGALPLLSFALSRMFSAYLEGGRLDRQITRAEYEKVGDLEPGGRNAIVKALQSRADQVFDGLPDPAHRATMRRVMLRLVATEGGELARRRVYHDELRYASPRADRFEPDEAFDVENALAWLKAIDNPFAAIVRERMAEEIAEATANRPLAPARNGVLSRVQAATRTRRVRQALIRGVDRLLQNDALPERFEGALETLTGEPRWAIGAMAPDLSDAVDRATIRRRWLEAVCPPFRTEGARVKFVTDRLVEERLLVRSGRS